MLATLDSARIDSPLGPLLVVADDHAVREIHFPERSPRQPTAGGAAHPLLERCREQLDAWFAGARRDFDLPLDPGFGTPFQRLVWDELRRIPYGATASYQEIAVRIGRPRAMRAVGAANARNPLPIVVPCHRVIGKSGQLVGFGGGLPVKERLLELERRIVQRGR